MCDWVIMLYSRKFTEHYKPARMEKNKKHYIKKKKKDCYLLVEASNI